MGFWDDDCRDDQRHRAGLGAADGNFDDQCDPWECDGFDDFDSDGGDDVGSSVSGEPIDC
jgi:hypothetical protein